MQRHHEAELVVSAASVVDWHSPRVQEFLLRSAADALIEAVGHVSAP